MSDRNFCERCGKRISALEWDIHTCTPPAQPQQEPLFWYRPCTNGMYEGPIHNAQIERVRKESGAWFPLYTSPPAQSLPFGVGGGLVAIKTLLSRDPCVHANTAIQMIDAMLAEAALHKGDA